MYEVPPEVVKSWPEPNYDNPETRGPGLIILVTLFFLVAAFIVPVRCYTRWYITNSFGADDIFIMVSMIPTACLAISVLVANINYGWDRHIWDMRPEKIRPGIKLALASSVLFAISSLLTKLSLCAFYLRLLAPEGSRFYKSIVWLLGFLSFVCSVSYTFQICFLCKPVYAFWDYVPPLYRPSYEYHCADRFAVNFYGSIANAVIDLLTMLVPAPIAWRLALPLRQRLAVIGIFGLGTVVCAAGVLKTKYIIDSEKYSYDEQWDGYPLWIAMAVEIDVGIICASAPALRPFIARYLPRVFNSSRERSDVSLENDPRTHKKRPFLFPHGSPTVRLPSDISQDDGLINNVDNYISFSGPLKSAPTVNPYSRRSSLDRGLLSRQREGVSPDFSGPVIPGVRIPQCKSQECIKNPYHTMEPSNTQSYHLSNPFTNLPDSVHGSTTTAITGPAPSEKNTHSNCSIVPTERFQVDEELGPQERAVVQGFGRREKPRFRWDNLLRGWT